MKRLLLTLVVCISLTSTIFANNEDALKTADWDGVETTSVTKDLVLEEDLSVNGDFVIKYRIDLNGFTINVSGNVLMNADVDLSSGTFNVDGNFHQVDNTLYVNGGELNVQGNYSIEGTERNEDGEMKPSYGKIKMTNNSDKITIKGDFIGRSNSASELTAGIITFEGDLIDYKGNTFKCADNHIVHFAPKNKASVDIQSGGNFQTITIEKDAEVYFKVLSVNKLIEDIEISGDVESINRKIDLNGYELRINGDVGKVEADINLNSGKLIIDGDLYHDNNTINLNKGTLEVKGNYYMHSLEKEEKKETSDSEDENKHDEKNELEYKAGYAVIRMENSKDKLIVDKDFVAKSNSSSYLSKGIIEFKGNVYDYKGNTLKCNTKNQVVFNGNDTQTVYFENGSAVFQSISTKNSKIKFNLFGVKKLTEDITISSSIDKICNDIDLNGKEMTIDGDVKNLDAEINLNGGVLHITGDLYHTNRTIIFNNGSLKVDGNYISQSIEKNDDGEYKASYGSLKMENDKDSMVVKGDFIANTNSSSIMNGGTIQVSGKCNDIKKNTLPEKGKEGVTKLVTK